MSDRSQTTVFGPSPPPSSMNTPPRYKTSSGRSGYDLNGLRRDNNTNTILTTTASYSSPSTKTSHQSTEDSVRALTIGNRPREVLGMGLLPSRDHVRFSEDGTLDDTSPEGRYRKRIDDAKKRVLKAQEESTRIRMSPTYLVGTSCSRRTGSGGGGTQISEELREAWKETEEAQRALEKALLDRE